MRHKKKLTDGASCEKMTIVHTGRRYPRPHRRMIERPGGIGYGGLVPT